MNETSNKHYLLLISIHGLIRGHDLELGRDADTGGQTKYVVDLARALGECEQVAQVDLVTRRIVDPAVSDDYAVAVEEIGERARIVRIDAGPQEYIPKEQLWDHLDSFTDNLLDWVQKQPRRPDAVHSHYADAGYVGVRLANLLDVPLVHTGHSLGRDKRKRLLARGMSAEDIEKTYNMTRRVQAEEDLLANADLVITSTHNEIDQQYRLYNYYDPQTMAVIPPGTDLRQFHPPQAGEANAFAGQLEPFLRDPSRPIVLALSRPDERKNIPTLVNAFGACEALREAANLVIIAGNREDIRDLEPGAREVLTELLYCIDAHDLHGQVALPRRHRPDDVPDIYRLAAASGGVFVNPALTEPFGLTLLEAAASGLPLVATENGGPVDIIGNCENGVLVDPLDADAMAAAIRGLLEDREAWQRAVDNGLAGVRRHYSWQAHAGRYLEALEALQGERRRRHVDLPRPDAVRYRDRAIFSDIDQSLLGDPVALPTFADFLDEHRRELTFGIATGRRIDSALAVLKKLGMPSPDVLISSLGTRIHYGAALTEDDAWTLHLDHDWNREKIRRLFADLPGLELQPRESQSGYKLSYFYDPAEGPSVAELVEHLHRNEVTANLIHSHGQFIDIVPARASKGQALRWVSMRLDIPLENIIVAGGSGSDEDLLRGNTLGVVVANRHNEELSELVDQERIFFASQPHAAGILEAVAHYDFLNLGHGGGRAA